MQTAAIGKPHFHAAVRRAQAIAAEQRHVERRILDAPVTLERRGSIDDRHVRRGVVLPRLHGSLRGPRTLRLRVRRAGRQEDRQSKGQCQTGEHWATSSVHEGRVGNRNYTTNLRRWRILRYGNLDIMRLIFYTSSVVKLPETRT